MLHLIICLAKSENKCYNKKRRKKSDGGRGGVSYKSDNGGRGGVSCKSGDGGRG